jgi:GT2 family glycosyltransferase
VPDVERTGDPVAGLPRIGVVVLTRGTRPAELAEGLASVLAQERVTLDVAVVGNGWEPTGLPAGVTPVALAENLGIPAGRNRGVEHVTGEYLFFLDDDASIPSTSFLADAVARLVADPSIGLLQPRVVDPSGVTNPRRWVPRIRKGDARASGAVFSVWEGAVLLPRSVFDRTGGWAEPFFYAHEGIELAWRVWDLGRRTWYAGDLVAHHPAIEPTRHDYYYRLNARNRVWLARRNLPAPLALLYVSSWTAIQVVRWARRPAALGRWFQGFAAGWREDPGERRPITWTTVARMTRAGRPPIV